MIAVFAAAVILVTGGSRYAWIRLWRSTVISDGMAIKDARVYRNLSGDLLIDLRSLPGGLYVVRKSEMIVGIPSASSVLESPSVVFAKHPLTIVNLRTEKAGHIDPKLVMTSHKWNFQTAEGKFIELTWD